MNYADPGLLDIAESLLDDNEATRSDIAGGAIAITSADNNETINTSSFDEIEQLTVDQAAKILGLPEARVKELIADHTLCCSESDDNAEPRLSAACVRAQAGKSKLEFIQEVKRMIAGENKKHTKQSVDMPENADTILQDLFDNSHPFKSEAHDVAAQAAPATRQLHVKGINRAEITNKNIEAVLENLDFTSVRLEGAMYRIGYLEAKVDDLQTELQIMPELRAKWAKSLILERECEDLKADVAERLETIEEHKLTIAEYKDTIARREHELLELHQFIDKLKESWWCRMWCWVTGTTLK